MQSLEYCARQAVENCLSVKPGERVVIIYDRAAQKIAVGIDVQASLITQFVDAYCMESYGDRPDNGKHPLKFPSKIRNALENADVSFLVRGDTKEGERDSFTFPMMDVVESSQNLRHAHMPGVSEEVFLRGMSADYNKLRSITERVEKKVERARQIRVMTPAGTDFTAELGYKWVSSDGFIEPGKWHNLPGSETFTCPVNLEGRIVVDGVLGDYFGQRYGLLDESHLIIKAQHGRIVNLSCPRNKALEKDFLKYIKADENANRFGELGIGTNVYLERLLGNLLHDEKFPGVHVAVGHPYPKETGADWDSKVHCDMVMRECDIYADGEQIMSKGKFASQFID